MSAAGARRAAATLMRVLGGDTVVVRFPSPPASSASAEQLGLASPELTDTMLSPVLVRTRGDRMTVLVAASVAEEALGVYEAEAVKASLLSASFVQVAGAMYRATSVEACSVSGQVYLYRLQLADRTQKGAAR